MVLSSFQLVLLVFSNWTAMRVFVYNVYLEQVVVDAVTASTPLFPMPVTAGIIQVNGRTSTQYTACTLSSADLFFFFFSFFF